MSLFVDLELHRGAFTLSADFDVPSGNVLAVLGPNGSGKSTLLDCLAGLLAPDRGTITLAARTLNRGHRYLPPHDRGIGLLAQDPLLFPHLTVLDNVGFAPRSRGASRAGSQDIARRWLAQVDAAALADRKPTQLSGGQAQRVAIARALAGEPDLLLLDEPLAALDVDAAPAIRGVLRRVLRAPGHRRTAVLVTHDPLDAFTLADRVVVLAGGRIVEHGPTREVLTAPRTAFTARIAGLNLVPGKGNHQGMRTARDQLISGVFTQEVADGAPAVAVFAPGAVAVHPAGTQVTGSPRNTVDAVVGSLEPQGAVIRLRTTEGLIADLTPEAVAELELEPGTPVRLAVKAAAVTISPVSGEEGSRG